MDIKDIRKAKADLETELTQLLDVATVKFTNTTGVRVDRIDVETHDRSGNGEDPKYSYPQVKIHIEI